MWMRKLRLGDMISRALPKVVELVKVGSGLGGCCYPASLKRTQLDSPHSWQGSQAFS